MADAGSVTPFRRSPHVALVVATVALFADSFLYGLVIPLSSKSPAVYNIAYAVGSMGSDVVAGALSSNFSFLTALLIVSGIVLVCTPLLFVGGRPAADASPPPDGVRQ
jgi:hypothetical protein